MDKEITVIVADDHEFEVSGITRLLSYAEGEIRVVGQARSAQDAVNQVLELKPDVILMDMQYYRNDNEGATAIRQIRAAAPQTSVLAMTAYDHLIEAAWRAGAHIVAHKNDISTLPALKQRIRDAYLALRLPQPEPALVEEPTQRELEVLKLMCEGLPDKEIAQRLHISVRTVKNHDQNIYGKLGVSSRSEAVAFALKHNLRFPD